MEDCGCKVVCYFSWILVNIATLTVHVWIFLFLQLYYSRCAVQCNTTHAVHEENLLLGVVKLIL
jgi:hypothetical protein